ncbi:MAG: TetR family transcriptional regulator [Rhizobiaceae bacterium]
MAVGVPESVAESIEAAPSSTRREILDAAAHCFTARGYANTSIDDVARSLGSTKGRIYHHYASKADLFADVFKTGMDMNYQAIMPAFEAAGNVEEKLVRMARTHTTQMIATKPYQRAVWEGVEMHLRGSTTPEQRDTLTGLLAHRDRYSDIFKSVISECEKRGSLAFDNLSIANQVMFIALNSPLFWYSPRPGENKSDIDKLVDQVVEFALRGLGYKGEIKS